MPTESGWALHNFTHDRVHGRKYKLTTLQPYADYKLSIREGTGEQPIWETFLNQRHFKCLKEISELYQFFCQICTMK